LENHNCYNCYYLSKRPGAGNYFIYKCSYWGIVTKRILPQSTVISSIGKRCPFFIMIEKNKNKNKKIKKKNNNDELDITI